MFRKAIRIAITTLATALAVPSAAGQAPAGDMAERTIIGFSDDGQYFAFEQFGIQDGSGFAFADIFVIDLEEDAWVDGTPVRVRLDDPDADIADAREQAYDQVESILEEYEIDQPGRLIAAAPVTEADQNPHELSFRRLPLDDALSEVRTVVIEELAMEASEMCAGLDLEVKGFVLKVRNDATGEATTVHEDDSLPASRGCALGYGVSDVIAYPAFEIPQVLVVLVNVFSYGFEGWDRRFIAIQITAP